MKKEAGVLVHNLQGGFAVGDKVIDLTAQENGWEDVNGVVTTVDGSHVRVRYLSGNERWKMHINLKKED